jgi:hypothetical protein
MKEPQYIIDLRMVEGNGSFHCPQCKALISPDDESEQNYTILDVHVDKSSEQLSFLILECKQCKAQIKLTGFLIGGVAS